MPSHFVLCRQSHCLRRIGGGEREKGEGGEGEGRGEGGGGGRGKRKTKHLGVLGLRSPTENAFIFLFPTTTLKKVGKAWKGDTFSK